MVSNDDCNNFREAADELGFRKLNDRLSAHLSGCESCAQWQRQNLDIANMVDAMPQFDVSEQLTQKILSSLPDQPVSSISRSFLIPVAVLGAAAMSTVVPFESLEGLASSSISLIALFVIHLLIKSARIEEFAT